VNEADKQPFGDQLGLTCDHQVKEPSPGIFRPAASG
jgi:hypothetical protein